MVEMGAEDDLVKGRFDGDTLIRAMRYGLERNQLKQELNRAHHELERRVEERTFTLASTAAQPQDTLDQLQCAQGHMMQQERLSALGPMASGIVHDFNNALSPIVALSERLLDPNSAAHSKSGEYLRLIHLAAKDSCAVVQRLREFYRSRDANDVFTPVALDDLIRQVREVLVVVLSEDGHKVESAASGLEGLKRLSVQHFDLVITDRAMPSMNGDQFATAARAL
jgi:C4-dicarboxylate-specific signal transduction histidine kinase